MKICFVIPPIYEKSGWGRYVGDVMEGAKKSEHTVSIVEIADRRLATLASGLIRTIWMCRGADIVYAIDGWPYGVLGWLATRLWRNRLIVGAIGSYSVASLYHRKTAWLVGKAYHDAHTVISISHYTGKRLLEKVPEAKLTVVTPGTALDKWQIEHEAISAPYILSVGGIKDRKGYHAILEALALARQKIPELKWVIVGDQADAGYVNQLKRRARELGIFDVINMREHVSDDELRGLYSKAKLFILLSENQGNHFEGFGIVFLEAAAAGLPVIGTTGNGIEDAIGPNNGIAVPQRDPQAAADAIVSIIGDERRWQSMSDASRQWAQEHQLDAMYAAHEEIYRKISGRM